MTIKLRKYQEEAVSKMIWDLGNIGNSIVSLPTGSGKSVVISEFAKRYGKPILILQPSKEILEQNYEKLKQWSDGVSIYSASMNSKEVGEITLATIQSIYKKPELFNHYTIAIVDECFIAGTKIDGKNIENIKPGDYVSSYNHKTKKVEKKVVLNIQKRPIKKTLYCICADGVPIISTPSHPYYVKNRGYVEAKNIKEGDTVYAIQESIPRIKNSSRNRWEQPLLTRKTKTRQKEGETLKEVRVEGVEILEQTNSGRFNNGKKYDFVYNLEVKDNHNYFANGLLVHNCHGISPKKMDGMYNKFFKAAGISKVYGLTATPYRQDVFYKNNSGWSNYRATKWQQMNLEAITTVKMINRYKRNPRGFYWSRILTAINIEQLQRDHYLSEVKYSDETIIEHQDIPTNKGQTDFDLEAYEELLSSKEQKIAQRLVEIKQNHKSVLVFCSSVAQAKRFSGVISGSDYVNGTMGKKQREKVINGLSNHEISVVFNVGVLTTGFDFPELEAVVLIRPTRSLNLYMQMMGRVLRIADDKYYGYIYDFSGTVKSLGKIESVKIKKLPSGWNVITNTYPEGICGEELFKYTIKKEKSANTSGSNRPIIW